MHRSELTADTARLTEGLKEARKLVGEIRERTKKRGRKDTRT